MITRLIRSGVHIGAYVEADIRVTQGPCGLDPSLDQSRLLMELNKAILSRER